MTEQTSQLEEEIESWEGFPWALRKEDLELWDAMIKEVRCDFGEAVEKSGKTFSTGPFFMALLRAPLSELGEGVPDSNAVTQTKLDWGAPSDQ